jgi:AraC-like DNA-binding protein
MFLVRSGAISGYEKVAASFGLNPVDLLSRVGLTPAQLRNPNTYISYRAMINLMALTGEASGDPYFGFLLSRKQNSSILGDMIMSVFRQPTLAAALEAVSKYLYLHARGAHIAPESHGETTVIRLSVDVPADHSPVHNMQMSVGHLVNFITEVLDLKDAVFPVLLRQSPPLQAETVLDQRQVARMEFDSPCDGVRIPSAWLGYQPHDDENTLQDHFRTYLQELQLRYPDNLPDQVKEIISQLLPSNECSVEKVAVTLDMHPRVLQQRLQGLACSYGDLLREVRQEVAEQHLRYPSTSITELAFRLGYAEVSVFSRSFKQWTGLSPRQWQQQHLA